MRRPEGKRPLESPRRRHKWNDNIKMDMRKVGCPPGDWIDLAQGPMVGYVMVNETPGSIKAN